MHSSQILENKRVNVVPIQLDSLYKSKTLEERVSRQNQQYSSGSVIAQGQNDITQIYSAFVT